MKQIVFFDIDGTLIDDETQSFPQSAVAAIGALRQAGHLAVINTGRPFLHIDPRVRRLEWDGIISSCGMEVRAQGRLIHQDRPTPGLCAHIRDLVRRYGFAAFYEVEDRLILDHPPRPGDPRGLPAGAAMEVERLRQKGIRIETTADSPDFAFEKFIAYDTEICQKEAFFREAGAHFQLIQRGGGMTEAVLLGNSKSTGIARILEHFSMTAGDACAFGDSANDVSMFQTVARSVAMTPSPPELRRHAAHVTTTVRDHGIARGLAWLGLVAWQEPTPPAENPPGARPGNL